MHIVVSPYHLTTREIPALASMLLAAGVYTMLPRLTGMSARDGFVRSAAKAPRYVAFMESWNWSRDLWNAGVLSAACDGDDAMPDIRRVCAGIANDAALAPLRPLMRTDIFEDEDRSLDAIASDLLKGGPDPAISVPVAAALDRFAAARGLFVARAQPVSVAQRVEANLGRALFAFAAPVLLQAPAARLMEARELLELQLDDLRAEVETCHEAAMAAGKNTALAPDLLKSLRAAADSYAAAFETHRADLTRPADDRDDPRTIAGTVTVSCVHLPHDAVLSSSVAAMQTLSGTPITNAARDDRANPRPLLRGSTHDIVRSDDEPGVATLIIKPLGKATARR
jgi:hypothetical protein